MSSAAGTQPASPPAADAGISQPETSARRPHRRQRVAEEARRRAVRACTGCRRLKEKCNGRQPCQRCQRTGRTCEFAPPGQSGPVAGRKAAAAAAAAAAVAAAAAAAVTTTAAGNSLRTSCLGESGASDVSGAASAVPAGTTAATTTGAPVSSNERVQYLEKLVTHLLGDVPTDLNNLRRIHDRISSAQRAGSGPRDPGADLDDVALKDENFTVKALSHSTAHYSGEFSHWNFSYRLRQRLVQFLGGEPGGRKEILEYWRATQLLPSPRVSVLRGAVAGCLPPSHVAQFLVQVYFRFAQTNSFYVEERWLRARLARLYDAPASVTSADAAWVCAVLMVLAIGTQFAHMAEGPEGRTAPGPIGQSPEDVGLTFYHTAARLLPDILTIASLESVQACLLLAHYVLPLDTHGLAYTYLGLTIKMAIQNGLHRRYAAGSTGDLDAWTIETRNRLWWTAYTVERRIGVLHGRPASIAPTEMDADLPRDLPEFRSAGPLAPSPSALSSPRFANMSALIDMTMRLSDIANAISLLRRCPKPLQPTYFERIMETWQRMQAWWAMLPADVRTPDPVSPMFRPNAHLKLCFHLDQMFIGRPFIFRDSSSGRTASTASTTSCASAAALASSPLSSTASPLGGQPSPGETGTTTGTTATGTTFTTGTTTSTTSSSTTRPSRRSQLVDTAVQAAYEVIALCQRIHETIGLTGSSYTEFSSCRAALLLLLAQSLNESPEEYDRRSRDVISRGCLLMRAMSVGGTSSVSTSSETSVVEALERAVRRLHAERSQRAAAAMGSANSGRRGRDGDGSSHRRRASGAAGDPHGSGSGGAHGSDDEASPDSTTAARNGYEMFCAWSTLVSKHNGGGGGGGGGGTASSGDADHDSAAMAAAIPFGSSHSSLLHNQHHHALADRGAVDPVLASFQPATFGWLPAMSSVGVPQPPSMLPDASFLAPWDATGASSDLGMSDIIQAFPQGVLDGVMDSGWPRLE